jgi:hypothetical protein
MHNYGTKAERREKKRNKKAMFKESGRSVKLLQEIIIRKARKAEEKLRQRGNDTEDTE